MEETLPKTATAHAEKAPVAVTPFTGYQRLVIVLLATLQFTIILDFMIISPLGDMLYQVTS